MEHSTKLDQQRSVRCTGSVQPVSRPGWLPYGETSDSLLFSSPAFLLSLARKTMKICFIIRLKADELWIQKIPNEVHYNRSELVGGSRYHRGDTGRAQTKQQKKNTLMCSHISGKMHSSLQNALASFCKEMQGASLPESAKIISNNKTSSGWSKWDRTGENRFDRSIIFFVQDVVSWDTVWKVSHRANDLAKSSPYFLVR